MIKRIVAFIICACMAVCIVSCSGDTVISDQPSSEDSSVAEQEEEKFFVTPFLEQEEIRNMLKEQYPLVSGWNTVYEFHSYADQDDVDAWQDTQEHSCFAVLSVENVAGFDRVLVSVGGKFELKQTEDGSFTPLLAEVETPMERPYMVIFRGFERNWKIGDCEDVEMIWKQGHSLCGFWYAEKGEALFFTDTVENPFCVKGLTEKPDVCHSCYKMYSMVAEMKDCYMLSFDRENLSSDMDGETDLAIYYNEKLTFLEDVGGVYPSTEVLSETVFAVGTKSRVCLYDVTSEDIGKPIKILGGNGYGLADSEVYIISPAFTDLKQPTRHCIMYYIEDEREWRFCTFETDGTVLDDFSIGLKVIDETITSVKFQNGLVYFSYRPDGAIGQAVHYCVDVRPNKNHAPQSLD